MITGKEYFAKGKRGIASLATLNGKKVLVKEFNPSSDVNTIAHEATMLQAVNKKGIGPAFIALHDGMLVREFIDGEEIADWLEHSKKPAIRKALLDILDQCRTLDLIGINKLEMTHPHKHILVKAGKVFFIDFDRARKTDNPKNVTQVCQWFTSSDMTEVLSSAGVHIDRSLLLSHAKSYKQQHGEKEYLNLREVIAHA